MSTVIEARRLNGTDLGKSLDGMGVIKSVSHKVRYIEEQPLCSKVPVFAEVQFVEVETHTGVYAFLPSTKITITGKSSPKPGDTE